jgi:hypothetical protein
MIIKLTKYIMYFLMMAFIIGCNGEDRKVYVDKKVKSIEVKEEMNPPKIVDLKKTAKIEKI